MRRHSPLHRRLFIWFGASILLTVVAATLSFSAIAHFTENHWERDYNNLRTFTGHAFARVWDDPKERDEFAALVAKDLDLRVTLVNLDGARLARFGPDCAVKFPWRIPVEGRGTVELCAERRTGGPLKLLIPLLVLGVLLWAASHKIAKRLVRPLREVARVAREIGDGNLEARPRLGRRPPLEVGILADAIDHMARRIQRQLEDQRVLLAAVSHELRTPLGHLRILTELAREGQPDKLDEVEQEIQEIDELVGQLLANARLDFTEPERQPIDLAQVGARALARKGLDVSLLEAEAIEVEGDPGMIARALANLVDNAEKHGGGLTKLTIARAADRVRLEAEDAGPGIPDGETLFQLFRSGTREHGNLGLGLFLVRRIAEAHGGETFADNKKDGGARIGFTIR